MTCWERLKSTEFQGPGAEGVVILPIGSTEQHGAHLPVGVDSMLVSEVAARAARLLATPNLRVLPTLWVSLAEHHMSFPGTLTLDFPTFSSVLTEITRSLRRQGFRKVLFLNGHGGNIAALSVVVGECTRTLEIPVAAATYWILAERSFAEILDGQPNLRHACEAETSMMLALAPDLVDMTKVPDGIPEEGLGEDISCARDIRYWSKSGVVGIPRLATPEKGERLLAAAARVLADRLANGTIWSD
jgi:creatinine amidohydrolase